MSVWPAWEVREGERSTRWLHVRLAFRDGATVEALASVGDGWVCLEDVQARPALALEDLAVFADWIEGPLARACGAGPEPEQGAGEDTGGTHQREEPSGGRAEWPVVAQAYRAAQERGADPVLAVMDRTGYSRRGALRLIGRTRDAGLLSPRHARRAERP